MSMADDDRISDAAHTFIHAFGLHRWHHLAGGPSVSLAMACVLVELHRAGSLRPFEVERRLRLGRSSVSRMVAALEERQWVERAAVLGDRRGIVITLTAVGSQVAEELSQARRTHLALALRRIPEQRQAAVVDALLAIADAVG